MHAAATAPHASPMRAACNANVPMRNPHAPPLQQVGKIGEASAKDLAQAVWALAKLGRCARTLSACGPHSSANPHANLHACKRLHNAHMRTHMRTHPMTRKPPTPTQPSPCRSTRRRARRSDKAALDALSKGLGAKLGGGEAPSDAAAALWALATLNYKPAGDVSGSGLRVQGLSSREVALTGSGWARLGWLVAPAGSSGPDLAATRLRRLFPAEQDRRCVAHSS